VGAVPFGVPQGFARHPATGIVADASGDLRARVGADGLWFIEDAPRPYVNPALAVGSVPREALLPAAPRGVQLRARFLPGETP
jgi:hypothetical protein